MTLWKWAAALMAVAIPGCQYIDFPPRDIHAYQCAGIPVQAEFVGDSLILTYQNSRHQLQHARTASGAKYSTPEGKNPKVVFWEKGGQATLTHGDHEPVDCQSRDIPPLPLNARGQEPGWSLTLDTDELRLNTQQDSSAFTAPTPKPKTIENGLRYRVRDDRHTLTLDLTREYCEDRMSGMPHPYTAKLKFGSDTFKGCAGEPRQLLTGSDWVVEDINRQGIIDGSRITLRFTDDGKVHGLAGCNRFSGRYTLTGESLTIDQLAQTRMACAPALMRQEETVLGVLGATRQFEIDKTGALWLKGPAGQSLRAHRTWPD